MLILRKINPKKVLTTLLWSLAFHCVMGGIHGVGIEDKQVITAIKTNNNKIKSNKKNKFMIRRRETECYIQSDDEDLDIDVEDDDIIISFPTSKKNYVPSNPIPIPKSKNQLQLPIQPYNFHLPFISYEN